jgi:hypothetical protein
MHYLKISGGLPNFEIPKIKKYKVDQLRKKNRPKKHKTQNTKVLLCFVLFHAHKEREVAVYKKSYFCVLCFVAPTRTGLTHEKHGKK